MMKVIFGNDISKMPRISKFNLGGLSKFFRNVFYIFC